MPPALLSLLDFIERAQDAVRVVPVHPTFDHSPRRSEPHRLVLFGVEQVLQSIGRLRRQPLNAVDPRLERRGSCGVVFGPEGCIFGEPASQRAVADVGFVSLESTPYEAHSGSDTACDPGHGE